MHVNINKSIPTTCFIHLSVEKNMSFVKHGLSSNPWILICTFPVKTSTISLCVHDMMLLIVLSNTFPVFDQILRHSLMNFLLNSWVESSAYLRFCVFSEFLSASVYHRLQLFWSLRLWFCPLSSRNLLNFAELSSNCKLETLSMP